MAAGAGAAPGERFMISVIAFDFARKQDRAVPLEGLGAALAAGEFCWVEAEAPTPEENEAVFRALGMRREVREEILGPHCEGRFDVHEDCLHFAVTEARFPADSLVTAQVDIVAATHYLLTHHRQQTGFLRHIRLTCHEDFIAFSQSPGFLLYEIGDHLIDQYRHTLRAVSARVESMQMRLFGQVDDSIFKDVAVLMRDLSALRSCIHGARELLHELATRRSPFVSETTQPFLGRMAGTMERLDSDLSSERELLAETLSLYMGMVGHRTSRVLSRLTVLSVVFLPLTFLCGVYGMNFQYLPEVHWTYGYLYFWGLAILVAGTLLTLMKRARWL